MDLVLYGIDIVFGFIWKTAFIWLPVILFFIAKKLWHHYVEEDFITGMEWVLLEIRIPRQVDRSPQAMELILSNAFYQATNKDFLETYWKGAIRFWFSLEMVSIEGRVHFYVRVPSRMKNFVETQVYAQYPQAEVVEAEDYTLKIPRLEKDGPWDLWSCEFKLKKHDAYPIKTYIDFGLDKAVGMEEEQKIDPLTPTIEYLGSIGKGQQVWVHIMIRATEKHYHTHGTMFGHHHFDEEVKHELAHMVAPYTNVQETSAHTQALDIKLPATMKDEYEAIQRKVDKLAFDTGIRCVYVARRENYDKNVQRGLRMIFRQYTSNNLNSLERFNGASLKFPFFDPTGSRILDIKNRALDQYRLRLYFYPQLRYSFDYPWPIKLLYPSLKPQPFVLNTEELATLFHFPGQVSTTPSFKRIDSRKSQPPSNLPM